MRNKKIAVYLCVNLLLATAGCSNSNTAPDVSTVDTINFNDVVDANAEENDQENAGTQQDSNGQSDHESSGGGSTDQESANIESDSSVKDDDVQQSNVIQSQADSVQPDSSQPQSDQEQLQSNSKLDGSIESIGDNKVVINKTFYPSENTAVSYGGSGQVLVTVYFSVETEFEVWTIKNGGVNGDSDIEKRQGAFSDMSQGASIDMTGDYDGNDFHARHVIIYNFV